MTALSDYRARLATEPLTANQRGVIMGHFTRLDLGRPAHRDGRLAITAALLGVERVGSVNDLTSGQAGRLVAILASLRDLRALAVRLAAIATENLTRSATETNGIP
jgi:hypothetical protein